MGVKAERPHKEKVIYREGREGGREGENEGRKALTAPQGVLTSSRLGMPCDEETKYIALKYGPWGFKKCI